MSSMRLPFSWLAGCLACLVAWQASAADLPRQIELPSDPLEEVLGRIRGHAASDAWKKEGWRDAKIEAWLDKLVSAIAIGAELPALKLPVRQADVVPVADAQRLVQQGVLVVGGDVKPMMVKSSIILADGSVELMSVEDCVIVARGAVSVQSSRNSVVVSGCCVSVQIDGRPNDPTTRNLVVSRGWADLQSGYGTILVALEGSNVAMPQDMIFVNAEVPDGRLPFGNANTTRSVKIPNLPLEPLRLHDLSTKIEVVGVVHADRNDAGPVPRVRRTNAVQGIVFRYGGRRYVADLDEPIVDEAGQPVEALRGWTLLHASRSIAIFAQGDTLAMVCPAAK